MCSSARDPWQEKALACVPHGDRSLLEMSSWLFCETYTCAFGKSVVYYSLCLQCTYFISKCHVERAWVLAFGNSGKHGLSLTKIKSLLEGTYQHGAQPHAPQI